MNEARLPESCVEHQAKYHTNSWQAYTLQELGMWVHLFAKRAAHRTQLEKKKKDLTDAQNYLDMMQSHLDALQDDLYSEMNGDD